MELNGTGTNKPVLFFFSPLCFPLRAQLSKAHSLHFKFRCRGWGCTRWRRRNDDSTLTSSHQIVVAFRSSISVASLR
uniref:Uncharacterized protein n=1 Tax=Setaria viridis TaxID=4556 RepID=A0A4U6U5Y0_SETVI|nr:hypothetical protein SEVIR_6G160833v2 [Setaria viridis]